METRRILITGGAGFVGSHLSRVLLDRGFVVTCYDSLDPATVNLATIEDLCRNSRFRLLRGDILDPASLVKAVEGQDIIIHGAAIASVDRSLRYPIEAVQTNVMGTLNVLNVAQQIGVNRIHYISTDEVYGQIPFGTFDERSPTMPRNPYAAGKAGGEAVVQAWGASFGLDVTITNSCNNYGPFQALDKLIPRSTVRAILGRSPLLHGEGQDIREWVHVSDHVEAILTVLEHGKPGERYCVGSGDRLTTASVVRQVLSNLRSTNAPIEYMENRRSHDQRYAVDASKLVSLGWKPKYNFELGVAETVNWYVEHREWWDYFAAREAHEIGL